MKTRPQVGGLAHVFAPFGAGKMQARRPQQGFRAVPQGISIIFVLVGMLS